MVVNNEIPIPVISDSHAIDVVASCDDAHGGRSRASRGRVKFNLIANFDVVRLH
jgi:hypothetical protein